MGSLPPFEYFEPSTLKYALNNAVGVRVKELPLTAEEVYLALKM